MRSLLDDPWVAAQIDAAAAPYKKLWPPEALAAFREEMAETLASNPTLSRLLREAHPTAKDTSGEMQIDEDPEREARFRAGMK